MSLTAQERETTITATDGDDHVTIWTAQRKVITALRKKSPTVTEVASGFHGGSEWAEFRVPADRWSPATGVKRASRPMTAAEREAAGERLARARDARA